MSDAVETADADQPWLGRQLETVNWWAQARFVAGAIGLMLLGAYAGMYYAASTVPFAADVCGPYPLTDKQCVASVYSQLAQPRKMALFAGGGLAVAAVVIDVVIDPEDSGGGTA